MEIQIVTIVVSALGMGAMISGILLRKIDRMDKKQDLRAKEAMKESVLIIRGQQAIGHLAEASAIAQKNGKQNGETETALKYYRAYTDDMNAFLLEQNAARNHGGF